MVQKEISMKKETIEEFLKRGGKVTKCRPGYPLDVGSLDKSKKPRFNKYEVESGKDKGTAPMPDLTSIRKQEARDGNTVTYSDKVPTNSRGTGKADSQGQ